VNTLPPSLVRYESQLEDAISRHRRRRPRRLALRVAASGMAAAAVALGLLSVLPGDGVLPGTGPSAVARAAALLAPSDGTILHTVVLTTLTYRDGSTSTERSETWQQSSAPYDHRTVSGSGNARRETAMVAGSPQAYVALTNTVYTVVPGTKLPPPRPSSEGGQGLVDRLRVLLASGGAREDGRVTVAGRDAVRIVLSPNGTLVVDAETYEPIEWSAVSDEGITETNRVETYERLPATEAALAGLDLRTRYPDAAVEPGITVEGFGPDPDKREAG
jgi:hypothetical protein